MPEITGREAVEMINSVRVLVMGAFPDRMDRLENLLGHVGNTLTETSDDILAELSAAGHPVGVSCNISNPGGVTWSALARAGQNTEQHATPLEALKALRAKLMPPVPVPMTREDYDVIMAEVMLITGKEPEEKQVCETISRLLMRHVAEG